MIINFSGDGKNFHLFDCCTCRSSHFVRPIYNHFLYRDRQFTAWHFLSIYALFMRSRKVYCIEVFPMIHGATTMPYILCIARKFNQIGFMAFYYNTSIHKVINNVLHCFRFHSKWMKTICMLSTLWMGFDGPCQCMIAEKYIFMYMKKKRIGLCPMQSFNFAIRYGFLVLLSEWTTGWDRIDQT